MYCLKIVKAKDCISTSSIIPFSSSLTCEEQTHKKNLFPSNTVITLFRKITWSLTKANASASQFPKNNLVFFNLPSFLLCHRSVTQGKSSQRLHYICCWKHCVYAVRHKPQTSISVCVAPVSWLCSGKPLTLRADAEKLMEVREHVRQTYICVHMGVHMRVRATAHDIWCRKWTQLKHLHVI